MNFFKARGSNYQDHEVDALLTFFWAYFHPNRPEILKKYDISGEKMRGTTKKLTRILAMLQGGTLVTEKKLKIFGFFLCPEKKILKKNF